MKEFFRDLFNEMLADAIVIILRSFIVYVAWTALYPVFDLPKMNYWQAACMYMLFSTLLKPKVVSIDKD